MPETLCCVCGRPAVRKIGRRDFCEEHYKTATYNRAGVGRSLLIQLVALAVFVGLVYAGVQVLRPVFSATSLLVTGVVLAVIPAAIWLSFFYRLDRLEPDPKGYVLGVAVLGGLLAGALGIPLVDCVFRASEWIYADQLTTLLGGILVVGFTQEYLKYAAVRYSIYTSPEFDEPTDGVIYATAAGLGFATVLNIKFVLDSGGLDLATAVIRMVVVSLAQASFAGITGYFLGGPSSRASRCGGCRWALPWPRLPTACSPGCAASSWRAASACPARRPTPGSASSWQGSWRRP